MENNNSFNQINEWQVTFDSIPDAISIMDTNFHIVKANKAFFKLFDLDEEKIRDKKCYEIIHGTSAPIAMCPHHKTMLTNKEAFSELISPEKGIFLEVSTFPIFDKDKSLKGSVHMVRDVSSRKRLEDDIRNSEEKLRSVIENIGVGVALISPKMKILALNSKMREWFPDIDLAKEPVCYKVFNRPPKDDLCTYCPTCITFKDGLVHEAITDTPTGNRVVHYRVVSSPIKDKDGKIVAAIEMVEDITEKRKKEIFQERISALVEYSEDAIISEDLEGKIISWNQGAEKMFGFTSEQANGRHISIIYPPEKIEELKEILGKIRKGESVIDLDTVRVHKKGQKINVALTASPIIDEKKVIIGLAVISRDITFQKNYENELRLRIEALERFQKITIGRELRMKELKSEIKKLKENFSSKE